MGRDVKRWLGLLTILAVVTVVVFVAARRMQEHPFVAYYSRIRVGMPIDQVIDILGRPKSGDCEKGCVWVWEDDGYRIEVTFPNGMTFGRSPPITSKELKTPLGSWRSTKD